MFKKLSKNFNHFKIKLNKRKKKGKSKSPKAFKVFLAVGVGLNFHIDFKFFDLFLCFKKAKKTFFKLTQFLIFLQLKKTNSSFIIECRAVNISINFMV